MGNTVIGGGRRSVLLSQVWTGDFLKEACVCCVVFLQVRDKSVVVPSPGSLLPLDRKNKP